LLSFLFKKRKTKPYEYLIVSALIYVIGLPGLLMILLNFLIGIPDDVLGSFMRGYFLVLYFFIVVFVVGIVLLIRAYYLDKKG
jgi:hypothetical protein